MINALKKQWPLGLAIMMLSIAMILLITWPHWHGEIELPGYYLAELNNDYLVDQEHQLRDDLLILAALEGVYQVIQSSEVGVNFIVDTDVGIGQLLAPLSREVITASEWLAFGLIINLSTQFVNNLGPSCAWILSIIWLGGLLIQKLLQFGQRLGWLKIRSSSIRVVMIGAFYGVMLFHIVVPYSIHGTHYFTSKVLEEARANNAESLANLHHEVVNRQKEHSMVERAKHWVAELNIISQRLHKKIDLVIRYRVSQVVIFIVGLLTPLIIIGCFLYAVKKRFHRWLLRDFLVE